MFVKFNDFIPFILSFTYFSRSFFSALRVSDSKSSFYPALVAFSLCFIVRDRGGMSRLPYIIYLVSHAWQRQHIVYTSLHTIHWWKREAVYFDI